MWLSLTAALKMMRPLNLRDRDHVGETRLLGARPADLRTAARPLNLPRANACGLILEGSSEGIRVLHGVADNVCSALHLHDDHVLR